MTVPGSNLLNLALTVIAPQAARHFACSGTTTTAAGERVPTYAAGVDLAGSFQPVSRVRMAMAGLDMTKTYAVFYVSRALQSVTRLAAPDQLEYGGRRWEVTDGSGDGGEWVTQDGWSGALLVDVGAASV